MAVPSTSKAPALRPRHRSEGAPVSTRLLTSMALLGAVVGGGLAVMGMGQQIAGPTWPSPQASASGEVAEPPSTRQAKRHPTVRASQRPDATTDDELVQAAYNAEDDGQGDFLPRFGKPYSLPGTSQLSLRLPQPAPDKGTS